MNKLEDYPRGRHPERLRERNGIIEYRCCHCQEWKPRSKEYFYYGATCFDKLQTRCIRCNSGKINRSQKRKVVSQCPPMTDEERKECRKKYQIEYRANNKESLKKKQKEYYQKNRGTILARTKEYATRNTDKINASKLRHYHQDPRFRIVHLMRSRMNMVFGKKRAYKDCHCIELLGCTSEEFKRYIESKFKEGMTWENHGINGWHIDHIRPLASINWDDPEDIKSAFHYTNTQPLWWHENLAKGDRIG